MSAWTVDGTALAIGPTFAIVRVLGNPYIKAEELRDFETGYRLQASSRVSLDVTGFAGRYRNLDVLAAQTPYFANQAGVPYMVLPATLREWRRSHYLRRGILRELECNGSLEDQSRLLLLSYERDREILQS